MSNDILMPMNHREIEYCAKKLSGCHIPDSFACDKTLLEWLDRMGERVFDDDLVMDYGTDCLRLYLLFENTPRENDAPYYDSWNEGALGGIYKFLGRYRRMILAAQEWTRRGNYDERMLSREGIDRTRQALEDTAAKISQCIRRGNTRSNRHNMVSAMMELLNIYQRELKTGEIITSIHAHAVRTAVPRGEILPETGTKRNGGQNPAVTKLCRDFVMLMAPYAPDLSMILWTSGQFSECGDDAGNR